MDFEQPERVYVVRIYNRIDARLNLEGVKVQLIASDGTTVQAERQILSSSVEIVHVDFGGVPNIQHVRLVTTMDRALTVHEVQAWGIGQCNSLLRQFHRIKEQSGVPEWHGATVR